MGHVHRQKGHLGRFGDYINLNKVAALKTLAEGSTVTLRFVPMATNASTKWAIKANPRLALYGNAE